MPEGDNRVLKAKKTICYIRYGMYFSIFFFLSELGTCVQNLIPTRGVELWEKNSFSARGYDEIHIQRPFFDSKNSTWKILGLKIRIVETYSSVPSTHRFFFGGNTKILISGGISKCHLWTDFGRFGRFRAVLGNLGKFWANFATLIAADSMPQFGMKS